MGDMIEDIVAVIALVALCVAGLWIGFGLGLSPETAAMMGMGR